MLHHTTAELTELRGWKEDLGECRTISDLPDGAREYLDFIAEHIGAPITLVGVGPAASRSCGPTPAARRSSAPTSAWRAPSFLLRIFYGALSCACQAGVVKNAHKTMLLGAALGMLSSSGLAAPGAFAAAATPTVPATSVSTNWAGYVAVPPAGARSRFSSVSGTWQQPSATCSVGHQTYSAAWVGLGGYSETSRSLEQIGTDSDCSRSGTAVYTSWYELLPAGPVSLKLTVHPGDQMSASVTVRRHDVTLRISDLSTGGHVSITKHVARIDTSSAEWIVEAPTGCEGSRACEILPLTDFGNVAFSAATATVRSHTGPISDPGWSATALELQQQAFTVTEGRARGRMAPTKTLVAATPSASTDPTGGFSVSWQEQSIAAEQPSAPTLPGSGGGPA